LRCRGFLSLVVAGFYVLLTVVCGFCRGFC